MRAKNKTQKQKPQKQKRTDTCIVCSCVTPLPLSVNQKFGYFVFLVKEEENAALIHHLPSRQCRQMCFDFCNRKRFQTDCATNYKQHRQKY
jgi:hypothetical protein